MHEPGDLGLQGTMAPESLDGRIMTPKLARSSREEREIDAHDSTVQRRGVGIGICGICGISIDHGAAVSCCGVLR